MTPPPDSCSDTLSGLVTLTLEIAGIPTVIPTKCRDTDLWTPCSAESRQISRQNGGIPGTQRYKRESTVPHESRHQSRHDVAINFMRG